MYTHCVKVWRPVEREIQSVDSRRGRRSHTYKSRSLPFWNPPNFRQNSFTFVLSRSYILLTTISTVRTQKDFLFLFEKFPSLQLHNSFRILSIWDSSCAIDTLSALFFVGFFVVVLPECINRRRYCRGTGVGRPISLGRNRFLPTVILLFSRPAGVNN